MGLRPDPETASGKPHVADVRGRAIIELTGACSTNACQSVVGVLGARCSRDKSSEVFGSKISSAVDPFELTTTPVPGLPIGSTTLETRVADGI